jgi:hypothetical protein
MRWRSDSGSSSSPNAVEPTISTKRTVTTLRVSAAPEARWLSGDPQDAQDCTSAAFADPHFEQIELPGVFLIKLCPTRSPGGQAPHLDKPRLVLHIYHTIEGGQMSAELPKHVKKYLKDMEVQESELTEEALDMFASLSGGEIALLRKLKKSLKDVDAGIIVKVH